MRNAGYLFGDFDTTVDSGQTGNRAALLEDLGSLAEFSETGEDVGDATALMNRLQEGAGLTGVVETEDLRTILYIDESPELLSEPLVMNAGDLVDGQVLDDDRNWVESVFSDPMWTAEYFENPRGVDSSLEPLDMGQHRLDLGLPEDFDYETAHREFFDYYLEQFRVDFSPGTSEMQGARVYAAETILTEFENLPKAWIDDLDLSPAQLEAAYMDSGIAYQRMTKMEAAARESGDITKADFLQGVLDNIDAQAYYTYQSATEREDALREAAVNSTLPETVHRQALLEALEDKFASSRAEAVEMMSMEDFVDNPALRRRFEVLADQMNVYKSMLDVITEGNDPVLYLDEMVLLGVDDAGTSTHRIAGMLDTQSELMQMFTDPRFGFTVDVGGLRSGLGVDDFDMAAAMTDMATRIDEYAVESTPGTTVLRDAVDRSNERALAQLENLPEEWLKASGFTDEEGAFSAELRRRIQDGSEDAYRILTKMEADARARGLGEGASREDLDMADFLATIIARLDRNAKSDFESALEAAEALRVADIVPLTEDVDQAAMIDAIQEQLAALDVRQPTLDPDVADGLAQIEAERAFLNGALSRVQDGYDPGPRLREMLLIAQDATDGDAFALENVRGAYQNVLDLLDDPQFRGLDLAGIDDAEQTGVATPIPKTDFDLPGEEIPDDSILGRLGNSDGAGNNVLFTVTDDAVYFDTPNAALRRQLDISPNQLSLEDMVGAVDELEDGSHVNSVDDTVVTPLPTTPAQSPPVGDRLPVGFDRRGAMDRLDEEIGLQNAELDRLRADPDADPRQIARAEAEIDARELARTEIEAGRDPRTALFARADVIDAGEAIDPEIAAAYRDTADYFGGSSAFATIPRPEVSLDGLLEEWRDRIAGVDSIEDRLLPSGAAEIERAEAISDVTGFMRQAVIDVSAGRDPRAELLRHATDLEARVFLDGESGAAEASNLRAMIEEYNALLSEA